MSELYEDEPHTGIFLKAVENGEPYGPAHEILIFKKYIEDIGTVIQKEYNFSNGRYYRLENTYGEAFLIVYADKILYPDGAEYSPPTTKK